MRVSMFCAFFLLVSASIAHADESPEVELFALGSPYAAFDSVADGHGPSEKGTQELGVGANLYWSMTASIDLGVGARASYGLGKSDTALFFDVPALARARVDLSSHGDSLLFSLGLGLAAARSICLSAFGLSSEIGLGYRHESSSGSAFTVSTGLALSVMSFGDNGPDSYLTEASFLNVQLPYIRIGLVL